jgi:hypothetical protein
MSEGSSRLPHMARDWEATLRSWVKPPSDNEDAKRDKTEAEIKAALRASSALSGVTYKVYAKGSYANNTNVRLDYDVDIAVECTDFYYYSKEGIGPDVRKAAVFEAATKSYKDGYTYEKFKRDVEEALIDYYGASAVTRGNIAMRVREKKTTLPADVVPCYEYHYVYDVDAYDNPLYYKGTRVYKDSGGYIHNWPEQQRINGIAKNNVTGLRYKRMVRALKRLENELVTRGKISELPSFFMECLVYNVPNTYLNSSDSYVTSMRGVLATIFNETLSEERCKKWLEVNERKYLFHQSQSWTCLQAHELAERAWDYIGFD